LIYTSDGGATWVVVAATGGNIGALWTDGTSMFYGASDGNVYKGGTTGFALFNTGGSMSVNGVLAGLYYNGAHYIGAGNNLMYVDDGGVQTQIAGVKNFISALAGYNGKTYISTRVGMTAAAGSTPNTTRMWTWTWTGAPPTPANGTLAEIQQGTFPFNFVAMRMKVMLSALIISGYYKSGKGLTVMNNEGQGAVYAITGGGQASQSLNLLFLIGPATPADKNYEVLSLFPAGGTLLFGSSYKTGIGFYDFVKGAVSAGPTVQSYADGPENKVLAVAYHKGKYFFAVKSDGKIWQSNGANLVPTAQIDTQEFQELNFITKLIDGQEGVHYPLNAGEQLSFYLSIDNGATFQLMGQNNLLNSTVTLIDLSNIRPNHWRARLVSTRGTDATKAPQILHWSERFALAITNKKEWELEILLPIFPGAMTKSARPINDPRDKIQQILWNAQSSRSVVDFIDRDGISYKVIILHAEERKISDHLIRTHPQIRRNSIWRVELFEVGS
jgi:hypothetical protein